MSGTEGPHPTANREVIINRRMVFFMPHFNPSRRDFKFAHLRWGE